MSSLPLQRLCALRHHETAVPPTDALQAAAAGGAALGQAAPSERARGGSRSLLHAMIASFSYIEVTHVRVLDTAVLAIIS
eukprot:4577463-Pleurochrysis_carterae.AAC.8